MTARDKLNQIISSSAALTEVPIQQNVASRRSTKRLEPSDTGKGRKDVKAGVWVFSGLGNSGGFNARHPLWHTDYMRIFLLILQLDPTLRFKIHVFGY